MKVYVTARFKNHNRKDIEDLCLAVKNAGVEDFSFIRDVENYQPIFDDVKDVWLRGLEEIKNCDALLIDLSDNPSGGRVVEAGISYGLGIPIISTYKTGTDYKIVYDGISEAVIEYGSYKNLTSQLKSYLNK